MAALLVGCLACGSAPTTTSAVSRSQAATPHAPATVPPVLAPLPVLPADKSLKEACRRFENAFRDGDQSTSTAYRQQAVALTRMAPTIDRRLAPGIRRLALESHAAAVAFRFEKQGAPETSEQRKARLVANAGYTRVERICDPDFAG